jgi:hypothetical protein
MKRYYQMKVLLLMLIVHGNTLWQVIKDMYIETVTKNCTSMHIMICMYTGENELDPWKERG